MTNNQGSVVSITIILTAAGVIVLGYRVGRTHAAWQLARAARNEVPKRRRAAWAHTRSVAGGMLILLAVLAAALNDLVH